MADITHFWTNETDDAHTGEMYSKTMMISSHQRAVNMHLQVC
jgi:hypothetical protein